LLSLGGKEQRLAAAAIAKQPTYEGEFKFAGVEDHYFLSVALDPGKTKVTFEPVQVPPPPGAAVAPRDLMAYSLEPANAEQPLKFYIGPKDFDQLALVDRDMVRAINFGVFTIIVVPLLRSLKWINGYIGNYGFSILALTAIINLIILPLRHKSVVSMRKMQEIQPEAKAIQDRYAKLKTTDPAKQKMNQELMALYRERGVNPASGCVPMLIPFPILIAFYSLLTTAIELRGAPFALWIHDLSLPDPYYVTPILMGGSQLWQQWIAPAAGVDPIQRRMMMIMPVVFTYLFISYPAGVALYWLASNLWAIGQQYGTNYLIGPPNIRPAKQPGERRIKRVGASKTDAAAREN
jgi:YidC/Oxa1 family membrane protein insertase